MKDINLIVGWDSYITASSWYNYDDAGKATGSFASYRYPYMSRRSNCHYNVVAESFFRPLKCEWIKKKIYGMQEEARSDFF